MSTVVTAVRRRWEGCEQDAAGKIVLRHPAAEKRLMKAAFGILALYLSIPLAIVAAQRIVAHEAAIQQSFAHAVVAQVVPAPVAQR
jgi:hypothetical protein